MGVVGAKVVESPDIDLSTWDWASGYYTTFGRIASDVIRQEFEKNPPELYLSVQYRDHGDRHPLDIDMDLPLGENTDESPRWRFNLRDLVADLVEWFEGPVGVIQRSEHASDPEDVNRGIVVAQSVVAALRELADELESRIRPEQEEIIG